MSLDQNVLTVLKDLAKKGDDSTAFSYVNELKANNGFQRQEYIKRYLNLRLEYSRPHVVPEKFWEGWFALDLTVWRTRKASGRR